jgi:hypothetical protein
MYIVICTDNNSINMESFDSSKFDNSVFGVFSNRLDAEEWVDNNCHKSYWSIVKVQPQKS